MHLAYFTLSNVHFASCVRIPLNGHTTTPPASLDLCWGGGGAFELLVPGSFDCGEESNECGYIINLMFLTLTLI